MSAHAGPSSSAQESHPARGVTEDGRRPALPRATCRLQLNSSFTFRHATRIVPYLARLGISHVYASPILKARPGSVHGYDVVDHSQLNPELGSREDFDRFVDVLHEHGMGLIVDIVPNHLGVMGDENPWWLDVLENGPAARYASHFDIDWRPMRASMLNRVLVPVLGDAYGSVLERGELKVGFDAAQGSFAVRYFDHLMPIDPREYPRIFASQPRILDELLPPDDPARADFESLLNAFSNLPPRSDTSDEARAVRYRDKEVHKRRLARLVERSPEIRQYIESTLERINGVPGEPRSFDALDALLEAQAYRLAYWRVATDEINYRRFFDVNDLAALRMNEREVFESTHALIFELLEQGKIEGLRIDHVDGLYDPQAYLERLQKRAGANESQPKPLYVLVEKILAAHERLPESWPVHGTTGYEFAGLLASWLVCADEQARMTRRYRQFVESDVPFDQVVYESKRLVMRATLAAEIEVLATQLDRIAQLDRHTADFTRAALREALREVIACFPVYRTYISRRGLSEDDARVVNWAIAVARKRSTGLELSVFDFLRDVLPGRYGEERPRSDRDQMLEFAMKFQQVTSPVAAKGVEDTAFYRYNRLVCLNEVGNDPERFGVSSAGLHQANLERARLWPYSLLATSTHDTKRSEDVRARIAVLSELPELWARHLARWTRLNRSKRRQLDEGMTAPDREDEYLLYQTLVGLWSADQDREELISRLHAYAIKAAREAKRSTSWLSPNAGYEKGLTDFVDALLGEVGRSAFVKDLSALAEIVAFFGRINSLAQVVLKVASPGVPDFYQGSELPHFALVDPDNRRPVDFERAQRELEALSEPGRSPRQLLEEGDGGRAKLYVTWKLLDFRRREPALFASGEYQPLEIEGSAREHVLAFARTHEGRSCIVLVPRWTARLLKGVTRLPCGEAVWGETRVVLGDVPVGAATDLFTGREVEAHSAEGGRYLRVAEVLADFPVAVLT
ncbi:MAG TPA: malto-oligosyltrehalose synthase [Steroidobacter sp.]